MGKNRQFVTQGINTQVNMEGTYLALVFLKCEAVTHCLL